MPKVRWSGTISPEVLNNMRRAAQAEDRSLNQCIERAMRDYVGKVERVHGGLPRLEKKEDGRGKHGNVRKPEPKDVHMDASTGKFTPIEPLEVGGGKHLAPRSVDDILNGLDG